MILVIAGAGGYGLAAVDIAASVFKAKVNFVLYVRNKTFKCIHVIHALLISGNCLG